MDYFIFIILALLFVIVLYTIAIYNALVSIKVRVDNAWAQIDNQLKRRYDLIPNLVETVKGYATHEKELFEKIAVARERMISSSNVQDKANASQDLSNMLKSVFAISEAYPDLKANTNFLQLQTELTGTEDKIAYARQFYNDAVQMYNEKILRFPENIFANIFNFKTRDHFQVSDSEKQNVKVEF